MSTKKEDVTFGSGSAAAPQTIEDPYVITNDAGEVIGHPVRELNEIDQRNARPIDDRAFGGGNCLEMAMWWLKYTGTKKFGALTDKNALKSFAWVKALKGFMTVRVTSLFSYVWTADPDTGKKAPSGKPLGYRLWTVMPSFDLGDPENAAAFDRGEKRMSANIIPMANAIGLAKSKAKLFDRSKKQHTHKVPRLMHRNFIMVDHDVEADGTVIITRVLANFYMRLQWRNKTWKVADQNGIGRDAKLYASAYRRRAADCTDDFLRVFEQVEGKDIASRVHQTLVAFAQDPTLSGTTELGRIIQVQARSMVGGHVDSLPKGEGTLTSQYNLIDRCCMYVTKTSDHYYGVEYTNEDAESEFTDFHCRLRSLSDPLTKDAQGLAGTYRINDGVHLVLKD